MDGAEVVDRLTRRFGLGTRPELRKALYLRLGELVETEGERALYVISSAVQDALNKREPGRYFAKIVLVRLIERRILPMPAM